MKPRMCPLAHSAVVDCSRDGSPLAPLALPRLYRGGFRCAHTEVAGTPHPYTYWAGWADSEVKTRFDHVLLRGAVAPTASLHVPRSALVRALTTRLPNPNYPSDHVSMVVELQLGASKGVRAVALS